jgi:hypothetical protein
VVAFTCEDLDELTGFVVRAWQFGEDRDWTVPAGTAASVRIKAANLDGR